MATTGTISLDKCADELWDLIKDWSVDVQNTLEDTTEQTIKESKKHIKSISHFESEKSDKKYIDCYTTRKPDRRNRYKRVLWNSKYQLSHLLEDGHDSYNQYNKGSNKPYTIHNTPYADARGTKHTHKFEIWDNTEKWTSNVYRYNALKNLSDRNLID